MPRLIFLVIGVLEFVAAGLLLALGWQLPHPDDIGQSFEKAERVTDHAGHQVRVLHRQVNGLRRLEFQQLADRLQKQTQIVTRNLRNQQIDFGTVRTMRDSLGDVAKGLNQLAETLDPVAVGKLGVSLKDTADFLDGQLVPTAQKAADSLEASTSLLRRDAQRLAELLKTAPLDLKAVRQVHDSLGKFREGLDKMNTVLRLQRLETVREGFSGMETSLSTGAEQVERLARYNYPVMTVNNLKVEVNQRPFWPEGNKIAAGMRKAAAGVTAANKEMEGLAVDLPRLRESLTESSKMVDKIRESMALALAQQEKLEPVLKDAPLHAARLAEELPRLGSDLAGVLRDTRKLKDVAGALREAQQGIDAAVARWPQTRRTLSQLATALDATGGQLDQALHHREEYEAAQQQTVLVAETFASMLPLITEQLDSRLDEEEQALTDLGQSLEEVRGVLPVYEKTATNVIQTGRWLAWLVAAIVGLHGAFLVLSAGLGKRFSE